LESGLLLNEIDKKWALAVLAMGVRNVVQASGFHAPGIKEHLQTVYL
jgi:hypothetical protein